MGRGRTVRVLVHKRDDRGLHRAPDELVVEEPMEIRLDGTLVATTMRTPGHDFELAAGYCFTEGLLAGAEVRELRYCATGSPVQTEFNVVSVDTGGRAPAPRPRLTATSSSCGLCGSATIGEIRSRMSPLGGLAAIDLDVLAAVPDRVRGSQELFDATGGVHAAAAFDGEGRPQVVREDIGRHNAVDKVVGRLLLDGALPASRMGLFVSGRASLEIVQKAWAAGFAAISAVSAPSSLAVDAARAARITLVGFAREGRLNVYAPESFPAPMGPTARASGDT